MAPPKLPLFSSLLMLGYSRFLHDTSSPRSWIRSRPGDPHESSHKRKKNHVRIYSLLLVIISMFSLFPVLLLALSAQASVLTRTLKAPRFTVTGSTGSQIRSELCVMLPFCSCFVLTPEHPTQNIFCTQTIYSRRSLTNRYT